MHPPSRPAGRAALSIAVLSVAVLVVALLGAGCSIGDAPQASKRSERRPAGGEEGSSRLDWSGCTQQVAVLAGLQCASLSVPLDPQRPDGDTLDLALARVPASGEPDDRIGSLVLNPGGPGQSGIEFLAGASMMFPDELTERFDLVSFDPRGVAASSPVRCLSDEAKDEQLEGDLSPDTPEEVAAAVEEQEQFAASCRSRSADMIEHMSTADVAADLDRIRAAVGDEKLTFVGFSYGTRIAATYATLFPDRVRALVADGAVSVDAGVEERLVAQATGFETTLARFVAACDTAESCALGPDSATRIASTRASLETDPVEADTASGTRTMGADLFDIALATALYDTSIWGTAARAIAEVRDGGAQVLFTLLDRQIGRQPDGTYDNSTEAQAMVNCADATERPSVEEAAGIARRIVAAAPTFGEALAWGALGCLDWPAPANPLPELTGAGAPPVVVIGTVGDPATPYAWAEEMASSLDSAVLLTYEGSGHTAFLRAGPCIDGAVVGYLVDLTVPPAGTRCAAGPDSISFGGLGDEVVRQFEQLGLPAEIAECIVDGIIDDVGQAEFDRMVLSDDPGQLSRLVTAHTLRCATGD